MYRSTFSWPWDKSEVSGQLHVLLLYSPPPPQYPLDRKVGGPQNRDPSVVQSLASRYTDCGNTASIVNLKSTDISEENIAYVFRVE
jgi:hypothetical protein